MKNKYEIRGDVTAIFIKCKGRVFETVIDTLDLPLSDSFLHTWQLVHGYVSGVSDRHNGGTQKSWKLHRLITSCPDDKVVDHIDHDKLNNRRDNLRVVTISENNQNYQVLKASKSGMRGVTWDKKKQKWCVTVIVERKKHYIGHYKDLEQAKMIAKEERKRLVPFSPESREDIKYRGYAKIIKERNRVNASNRSKTGMRGISWSKQSKKWRVDKKINGKRYYSMHDTIEEAIQARKNIIQHALV